jgi:hypothetical protein
MMDRHGGGRRTGPVRWLALRATIGLVVLVLLVTPTPVAQPRPSLTAEPGIPAGTVSPDLIRAASPFPEHPSASNLVPSTWAELATASISPPVPSSATGFVDDPADGVDLEFGGLAWSSAERSWVATNQTWTLARGTWNLSTPAQSPPTFASVSMAYDPDVGAVVLVGTTTATQEVNSVAETWEYSAGRWTELSSSVVGAPAPSLEGSLAYDPIVHALVAFGGYEETWSNIWGNNETWLFENGTWTNVTSPHSPAGEIGAAMGYDPSTRSMLLYGGNAFSGWATATNSTWQWANGTWSKLRPWTTPPGVSAASLVWSPQLGAMTLVGGARDWTYGWFGVWSNQTWEYQSGNWTLANLEGNSPWRSVAAATLDPSFGGIVTLGATGTNPNHLQTWELTRAPAIGVDVSVPSTDANLPVTFHNVFSNTTGNVSVAWTFGDGRYADGSCANHSFRTPGTYVINATAATEVEGVLAENWAIGRVEIVPDPAAALVAGQANVDLGQNETLSATALNGTAPYTVSWTFGDGTNSSGNWSVRHRYLAVGTYPATVRVVDSLGVAAVRTVDVHVEPFPLVTLAFSRAVADLGQSITVRTSTENGSAPFTYTYEGLPPGCAADDLANLTCVPSDSGEYDVVVTVVDSHGVHSASAVVPLTIAPPLAASLSLSSSVVDLGMPVTVGAVFASEGSGDVSVVFPNDIGCGPPVEFVVLCRPSVVGEFSVTGSATDAAGVVVPLGPLNLTVEPPVTLVATGPTSSVTRDTLFTIAVTEAGGTAPFSYSFPTVPSGCVSLNQTTFRCDPLLPGFEAFHAIVSDSLGSNATARLVVVVVDGPPGGVGAPTSPTAPPPTGPDIVLWALVGLAIAQVGLSVRYARRPRRRPTWTSQYLGIDWSGFGPDADAPDGCDADPGELGSDA